MALAVGLLLFLGLEMTSATVVIDVTKKDGRMGLEVKEGHGEICEHLVFRGLTLQYAQHKGIQEILGRHGYTRRETVVQFIESELSVLSLFPQLQGKKLILLNMIPGSLFTDPELSDQDIFSFKPPPPPNQHREKILPSFDEVEFVVREPMKDFKLVQYGKTGSLFSNRTKVRLEISPVTIFDIPEDTIHDVDELDIRYMTVPRDMVTWENLLERLQRVRVLRISFEPSQKDNTEQQRPEVVKSRMVLCSKLLSKLDGLEELEISLGVVFDEDDAEKNAKLFYWYRVAVEALFFEFQRSGARVKINVPDFPFQDFMKSQRLLLDLSQRIKQLIRDPRLRIADLRVHRKNPGY